MERRNAWLSYTEAEEKEMNATGVGIIAGVIFFIICIIMALS